MMRILVLVTCFGLAAASAAHAHGAGGERMPLEPRPLLVSEAQRAALGIEVAPVQRAQRISGSPWPGRIVLANAKIDIVTARRDGVLRVLHSAPGDAVLAGQELGVLDSAGFVALQRDFLAALSRRDLAKATAERERDLAREGVIAGRRGRESAENLIEASARMDERRQALVLAGFSEADITALATDRRLTTSLAVRTAIDGDVLEQYVRPGQHVEAGTPLYRIGARDGLLVEIHVPVEVSALTAPGSRIELVGSGIHGTVIAIGRQVHDADQGVPIRARIDDGDSTLRPGQFVEVSLTTPAGTAAVFEVPSRALVRAEGKVWAFRATPSGFEPVQLVLVGGSGASAFVRSGLAAGEYIAVRGTAALKAIWSRGDEDDD